MTSVADRPALRITPAAQYVLRLGDTCLIHAQRLAEWAGHGPALEEDIALTNMALDLLGQARALLTLAGQLSMPVGSGSGLGSGADPQTPAWDEDALAFERSEQQFFNLTLVEQPLRRSSAHAPGGDFADTVLRNFLLATWLKLHWRGLATSTQAELAAIAGKAVKEARYHQQHNADWVLRLGGGTETSARRLAAALDRAWPWCAEMFAADAVDSAAVACGLGPARSALRADWLAQVQPVLAACALDLAPDSSYISTGSNGQHSEHMGFILAEMQSLHRQFPGGRW
jgi:ring-1,2-phenylacetyl-CoA epoxidase subunit PaaC